MITTHVRPDGDALGSQLALGLFLRKLGKQVAMINSDPPPENLGWLPESDLVEVFDGSFSQHERIGKADVVVVVDTGAEDRLGRMSGPVRNSGAIKVLIDHHPAPEQWFDQMYLHDTASSTGELIYEVIVVHDASLIDEAIATALYVAVLTDTGSFRYSSVTPAVHRFVADLLERGGLKPDVIHAELYERRTSNSLRLLAAVLDTLTFKYDGQLSYVVVSLRMLKETGTSHEDTEGIVNYALSIEGVRVALIFSETPSGTKVSFRSRGNWGVSVWARSLGGGGHHNASGAFLKRPLEEVIDTVIASAPSHLPLQEAEPGSNGSLSEEDAAYLSTLLDMKAKQTQ